MAWTRTYRHSYRSPFLFLVASLAFTFSWVPPSAQAQPSNAPADAQGSSPPTPGYYLPPPSGYYPPPPPGYYPGAYVPPPPLEKAYNTIFVELGGNAVGWSLNYERFLTDSLSGRIGFGYYSLAASNGEGTAKASLVLVPLTVNYLLGRSSHKLELGAGCLYFHASASIDLIDTSDGESGSLFLGTATMGYRYSPYDGGFVFRAGFTPFFGHGIFLPWLGISFGYGF